MAEYEAQMAGIYSTCVVPDTLDESPMAYKNMDEIVENIGPTADILCRISPYTISKQRIDPYALTLRNREQDDNSQR